MGGGSGDRMVKTSPFRALAIKSESNAAFWFGMSLVWGLVMALLCLQKGFSNDYIINDDARQHVFWMHRLVDPDLFPKDMIADYFQAVAPWGYKALYQGINAIGIHPLLANKLLPPILLLITAAYSFGVCWQVFPAPLAGFLASVLLSQNLLVTDDLLSGTPRAFAYPLILAFLYYWLHKALVPCVAAIILLGLFYPQMLLLACVCLALGLGRWQSGQFRWSPRQELRLGLVGLLVGMVLLGYYATVDLGSFEPTVTIAQARVMPELSAAGRSRFFDSNWLNFWVSGDRAGLLPRTYRLVQPPLLLLGLLLPWLLRHPQRFPLTQKISENSRYLVRLLLASLLLWGAAHLLLFRLHLPSRYTQFSFRILLAIAAGIVLSVLGDRLRQWVANRQTPIRRRLQQTLLTLTCVALLLYPVATGVTQTFPRLKWRLPTMPNYFIGKYDDLYQFLSNQPKDTLIASLAQEANNLPSFAARSVLVSREYAIPYHLGYYQRFRERAIALLEAQYSLDPKVVQQFNQRYGIDLWVVDVNAFTPQHLLKNRKQEWLRLYQPTMNQVLTTLEQGKVPIVQQAIATCSLLKDKDLIVLDAACITTSSLPR
jgi:hypothetical protein